MGATDQLDTVETFPGANNSGSISWCEQQRGNFSKYRNGAEGQDGGLFTGYLQSWAVAGDVSLNTSRWVQSTTEETLGHRETRTEASSICW